MKTARWPCAPRPATWSRIVAILASALGVSDLLLSSGAAQFDGAAPPVLSLPTRPLAGGGLLLRATGQPGVPLRIEAATQLADWLPLATLSNATGTVDYQDPEAPTAQRKLYRAAYASPDDRRVTLYSNQSDPLFLSVLNSTGEFTEYYGIKDAEGQVTALTSLRYQEPSGTVSTVHFDEAGRIKRIATGNGVIFRFNWTSSGSGSAEVVSPDNLLGIQIPLSFDGAAVPSPGISVKGATGKGPWGLERLSVAPPGATFTTTVRVTQCGKPVNDAEVTLALDGMRLLPTQVINGVYLFQVPHPNSAVQVDLCESVKKILGEVGCDLAQGKRFLSPAEQQVVCTAITVIAVAASEGALAPAAAAIQAACGPAWAAVGGLCSQKPCDIVSAVVNRALEQTAERKVLLCAEVLRAGQGITECATVTAGAPFHAFDLTLPQSENFELKADPSSILAVGNSVHLVVVPECEDFQPSVQWNSSNPSVASVAQGVVTGKRAGTADITARDARGRTRVVSVAVLPPAPVTKTYAATFELSGGDVAYQNRNDAKQFDRTLLGDVELPQVPESVGILRTVEINLVAEGEFRRSFTRFGENLTNFFAGLQYYLDVADETVLDQPLTTNRIDLLKDDSTYSDEIKFSASADREVPVDVFVGTGFVTPDVEFGFAGGVQHFADGLLECEVKVHISGTVTVTYTYEPKAQP